MYFNSSTSLLNNQLYQNYTHSNGTQFCASTHLGECSADEHETEDGNSKIRPAVALHNCLNQLEKCTVENCALNIFDNVVVKEELIIDDYEDSESVIANYYYDSFEKWSEFGQPLKTFLQNSNFNYHVEENYLADDKMLEDTISNNSSYDDSSNSLAGSNDTALVIQNQEWALEKVFKSESLAKSYLDEQNWSLRVRYNTQYGMKSVFRCNLVQNKMPQCAAKVSMEYNKKSKTFLLYSNRRKHTHGTILFGQSKLHRDRQKVIELELADLGLSKYEIQLHLENNGYNVTSDTLVKKTGTGPPEPLLVKPLEMKPKSEFYSKMDNSKWILEKKFVNSKFALQYMKQTGLWAICSKKRGRKNDKQYYRCNRVRKVGPQCAAQKYLLMDHTTGECLLFGINEHTHDLILSMAGGSTSQNVVMKTEPESDNENDENYEYYGYDNSERRLEETVGPLNENISSTFNNNNGRQNGNYVKANKEINYDSNDRLSPLSSNVNKNTDHFWILNRTFKNGAMAKSYLDEHKVWKLKHRELNGIGLKCIYRCGLVEVTATPQCAAIAYAQYHAKNEKVFFYTNSLDHTHGSIMKNDNKKIFNKVLRNHPKINGLNGHIKADSDTNESNNDSIMESPRERLNLRKMKPESRIPEIETDTKSPKPELLEYVPPKKKFLPWKLEEDFATLKDALTYMENKPTWYMWKKQNFKYGGSSKSYYKCTIKLDNNHCPAQKHLFVDKASNKISIYRCHDHTHEPSSPVPGSPTPGSPTPGSPIPSSPTPCASIPGSPTPGSPTPGSPTPGSPTPGSPTSGSPTPGSPTPGSPTAGSPTPDSPTSGSPTPGSPTPGCPTPGSPTPFDNSNSEQPASKEDIPITVNNTVSENATCPSNSVSKQLSCSTNGTWGNNWRFERKFKNMPQAIKFMKDKEIWSICGKLKVFSGYRQYYRCNLVKKSGPQCDAKKYLFFNSPTSDVLLYGCNSHTHDLILLQNMKSELEGKEEKKNSLTDEKRYVFDRKFKNLDLALSYLKEANTWTHHNSLKSLTGERRYYLCKLRGNGKGALQCEARCCLSIKTAKQEVILYNRSCSHTHSVPYKPTLKKGRKKSYKGKKSLKKPYTMPKSPKTPINVPDRSIEAPTSKLARQYNTWYLERNFVNSEFALRYMKREKIWSVFSKRRVNNGNVVQYYRCNEVKKKTIPQCAAQKYLVFYYNRAKVSLYGRNEHTHEAILAGKNDECEEDNEQDNNVSNNSIDAIVETENTIDDAFDEPLNENLYAVDVVIEEDEETPVEPSPPKTFPKLRRGRGLGLNYVFEKRFRNSKTARGYIKSLKIWSVTFTGKSGKSFRQRFRCNLVGRKGTQCAARKYLVYHSINRVELFTSNTDHTHDEILASMPDDESFGPPPNSLKATTEKTNELEDLPTDTNESTETGKRRKSWKRKFYSLERKFKNAQSAKNYMKIQKEWSLYSKTKREFDMKQYYRCNFVKAGGPQCKAGKFLLYSKLKKEVSLFYCNNHTHDTILQNCTLNESGNISETYDDEGDEAENETIQSSGASLVD